MNDFPLFPLPLVAFPECRLPLQIFEPRYLDLVKASLAGDSAFGIVTQRPDEGGEGSIRPIGTAVRIIDFHDQPNGLLGIVCSGERRFRIERTHLAPDGLVRADIEWLAPEPVLAVPGEFVDLVQVLQALLEHPYARSLGYQPVFEPEEWLVDASRLGFLLAYLLPLDKDKRYQLLAMEDATLRLQTLQGFIDSMQH